MTTFSFCFGCTLGQFVLKHTDNLIRNLQGSSISVAQKQKLAKDVCKSLYKDRREGTLDFFLDEVVKGKKTKWRQSFSHSCQENDELLSGKR